MSDTDSDPQSRAVSGIPEHHFLRLALDLLTGLEIQSRERGHDTLASLIDIARGEAAGGLSRLSERIGLPDEPNSLRLANALRTRAFTCQAPQVNTTPLMKEVQKARQAENCQGIDIAGTC